MFFVLVEMGLQILLVNNFDQSPFHLSGGYLVRLQKWGTVPNFPESKIPESKPSQSISFCVLNYLR